MLFRMALSLNLFGSFFIHNQSLIKQHSLRLLSFANDIPINTSVLPKHVHGDITSVSTCISLIKNWMIEKKL